MKVSIIGTGYVGLVSGTCFAEIGHEVTCIDIDPKKIKMLEDAKSPIYEPGLEDLLSRNIRSKRLKFSTDYSSVASARVCFLAVGTPSADNGEANLDYLKSAALSVAENLSEGCIVVIKSTVPVGTHQVIEDLMKTKTTHTFHIVNNPEFLKEGSAIDDFMKPDRVVVGHNDASSAVTMEQLYEPLVRQGNPIYLMSNASAEMTKYAANCFLATKISFINDIAHLCEKTGADIDEVRKGMTSDERIGHHFFYPGVGYGGSCFPKDVRALIRTAEKNDLSLDIVRAAETINSKQKLRLFEKTKDYFKGELKGKTFAFWGCSFKPNTDDIREAPSIDLARAFLAEGASVNFFDPVAMDNYEELFKDNSNVARFDDRYECLEGANALLLITEWGPFKVPDFELIKKKLKTPVIFDGRNLYNAKIVQNFELDYFSIGKKA